MGANESQEDDGFDENGDIEITVESGMEGGNPQNGGRKWHGTKVSTIILKKDATVASFLRNVQGLPWGAYQPRITVYSIYMGEFRPKETDLHRTVYEMGLRSGTLKLHNGLAD